jgi:GT2 family glycosyltransferase
MCIPQSTVYHVGGGTLKNGSYFKTYLNYRNNLLMLYKNLEPKNRFKILFTRMLLDGISSAKMILDKKPHHIFAILKAHIHYYTFLKKFRKKRPKDYKTSLPQKSIVFSYFFGKKKEFNQLNSDFS